MKTIYIFFILVLVTPPIYCTTCSCTSASAPVCVSGACQPCRQDSDCSSISGAPYCSNSVCQACNELTNKGCTLASPYCSSSGTCTACTQNLDCQTYDQNNGASSITHVKCSGGACSTSSCSTSSDCLLPSYPMCTSGACKSGCSTNSDCSHFGGSYPYCISSKCRQCQTDADCSSGQLCSTSSDATQYNCVSCEPTTDRGCTASTSPYCVLDSPTATHCTGCYQNSDCSASVNMKYQGRQSCNMITGECGSAQYSTSCSGTCSSPGASYCYLWPSNNAYQCTVCMTDSECTQISNQNYCKGSSCVGCTSSSNCPTVGLPRCDPTLYQCANCLVDSDCQNYFPKVVCYSSSPLTLTSYECVQCASNSDCQMEFTNGVCYSNNTCSGLQLCSTNNCNTVAFPQCDSSGYCRRCSSDSDCSQFATTDNCYMPSNGSNVCVQCYNSSQCNGSAGYYCTASFTCVKETCSSNSNCNSNVPECINNDCVKCSSDSQCKTKYNDIRYVCCANYSCAWSSNPCLTSSNCTNINLAYCNDGVCNACTQDSDCSHLTATPYCMSGTCINCRTSSDCNSTAPICGTVTYQCGGCQDDNDCSGHSSTPYCVTSTGKCEACASNFNCPLQDPLCRTSDYTCQPCTTGSDCYDYAYYWGCETTTSPHTCVQCTQNSDCQPAVTAGICDTSTKKCSPFAPSCTYQWQCTTNDYPVCTNGICMRCESDPDCYDNFPYDSCLEPSSGLNKCVQCLTNYDCSTENSETCNSTNFCTGPACNQTEYNNTQCSAAKPNCVSINCRACYSDTDCFFWYWEFRNYLTCSASALCVATTPACTTNANCPPEYPVCELFLPLNANHCFGCSWDGDCSQFPSYPYCSYANNYSCVECLNSTNCTNPAYPVCNQSTNCIPCSNDTDCQLLPDTPYCDVSSGGVCRACVTNDNCMDVSDSRCDPVAHTCQPCQGDGDCSQISGFPRCVNKQCVECTSNADCTDYSNSQCSSNTCIPCATSSDCTQITDYPYCIPSPSTNACSQCNASSECPYLYTSGNCSIYSGHYICRHPSNNCTIASDCSGVTYPICDLTEQRCRRCINDTECSNSGEPYCYPLTGASTCRQCRDGSDCAYGSVCNSAGACVAFNCANASSCVSIDPTLPECDSNDKCIMCSNDTQCQGFYNRSYGCNTATGACFDAATPCATDNDCPNSFLAKCSPSDMCEPCDSDTNCNHITGQQVCRADLGGYCLQCNMNLQCVNNYYPVCGTNGLCQGCTTNQDCSALFAPQKPLCSSFSHGCVQCTSDSYCLNSSMPYCRNTSDETCVECLSPQNCPDSTLAQCNSSGFCSPCTTSADCSYQASFNKPYCSLTLGCVRCIAHANCSSPTPSCDISAGLCVACVSNSNCTADPTKSACDSSNVCAICAGDSDCTLFSGLPKCSTSLGCVQCLSDSDCTSPGYTYCKVSTGTCVECLSNSACNNPATSICDSSNTCTMCAIDSGCLLIAGLPKCSTSLGCVQCLSDTDCTAPNLDQCNVGPGTCVQCLTSPHCTNQAETVCTSYQCTECTSNSDCNGFPPNCLAGSGCVSCITYPNACASNQACNTTSLLCQGNF